MNEVRNKAEDLPPRWLGLLLFRVIEALAFIFSPIIILCRFVDWLVHNVRRTPADVLDVLRNAAVEDSMHPDWDEFVLYRIADPELEAIRLEAKRIDWPLGAREKRILHELAAKTEALQQARTRDGASAS